MRVNRFILLAAIGVLAFACSAVSGQAPAATPKPAPEPPKAQPAAPEQAPELSDLERTKIENLTLKMQLLNDQFSQLVAQIDAAHPGWQFNPQLNRFIKVVVAAPIAAKPTATELQKGAPR